VDWALGWVQEYVRKGVKNTARGLGGGEGDSDGPFIVGGREGDRKKFVHRCVS
jgi:hypothetical protein